MFLYTLQLGDLKFLGENELLQEYLGAQGVFSAAGVVDVNIDGNQVASDSEREPGSGWNRRRLQVVVNRKSRGETYD
jgi:hypothetical protein